MIFWCRIVLVNGWDDLYMFVFCEREIPNLKNQNAIFEISMTNNLILIDSQGIPIACSEKE